MGNPNPKLLFCRLMQYFKTEFCPLFQGLSNGISSALHWKRVSIELVSQNLAEMGLAISRILGGPFLGALEEPELGDVETSRVSADYP